MGVEKMQQGEKTQPRDIIENRAHEALEAKRRREQARKRLQTPAWLSQKMNDMLPGEKFVCDRQDKTEPHVIAFHILGELITVNRSEDNEPKFFSKIGRLLPGRPETEYQALYQHALEEWTETYGD